MATVDMTSGVAGHASAFRNKAYVIDKIVDFADVITAKGSAIAASDVIQILDVPAGSLVFTAGMEVISAMTGTSTDTAFDLGVTGGDVDVFVDGFDFDGASAGAYAALASSGARPVLFSSDDTIDLLIAAQTGTITGGKIRFWAVVMNVDGESAPGIATAGS